MNISINITNRDGSRHSLERKDHIKYLGVMIDSSLSWKYHISYVCAKLSWNIGIISKLRYYLSVNQLKQIYYNLIYPYISYAIVAWGSTCKTNLQKIQTKQNRVIRLIFFATSSGENTASALPLLNIMDILTVNNVYRLHTLKFTYAGTKVCCQKSLTISSSTPVMYIITILGMLPNKICTSFELRQILANEWSHLRP